MERAEAENERRSRRAAAKQRQVILRHHAHLALPPPPITTLVRAPSSEAKLAAIAIDLNVRLRAADMPASLQERAFRFARALLDANPQEKRPNPTHLAMSLKKEFDSVYGPAWHCIVGKSFGSFVTHSSGGFVYFSVEKLSFLVFKTQVRPVIQSRRQINFVTKT
uniref:Dynein light chain n=1 Tax=Ziziphus jujuba TaxID=326968 RepID=A0A6P3ZF28_ZIZJJ